MLIKLLRAFAILLLFSLTAYGRDLWDPPWDLSLPNQTYQAWEFSMYTPGIPFQTTPTIDENPFGTAEITEIPPFTYPDWVLGPEGTTEIATLHIDVSGPFTIWVPNNPNPNDIKLIFWQITSDKSPTPTGSGSDMKPSMRRRPSTVHGLKVKGMAILARIASTRLP